MPTIPSLRCQLRPIVASGAMRGAKVTIATQSHSQAGLFAIRVNHMAILVFSVRQKKRTNGVEVRFVNHGLNLPDHATFANTGVRERSAVVAASSRRNRRLPWPDNGSGRSLQRSVVIHFEQKAAVFHRQRRRVFLAEIDPHPAAVSSGNQETLRRTTMKNQIECGRTQDSTAADEQQATPRIAHKDE